MGRHNNNKTCEVPRIGVGLSGLWFIIACLRWLTPPAEAVSAFQAGNTIDHRKLQPSPIKNHTTVNHYV